MSVDELEQQTGKKAAVSLGVECILQAAAALGLELEGRDSREKLRSEMDKVAWGTKGSYVERSNEESRSTSSVVARMRDHGSYAS